MGTHLQEEAACKVCKVQGARCSKVLQGVPRCSSAKIVEICWSLPFWQLLSPLHQAREWGTNAASQLTARNRSSAKTLLTQAVFAILESVSLTATPLSETASARPTKIVTARQTRRIASATQMHASQVPGSVMSPPNALLWKSARGRNALAKTTPAHGSVTRPKTARTITATRLLATGASASRASVSLRG